MVKSISEYMLKSLDERKSHLDLTQPCVERGGHRNNFRGVLAEFLNTEFPTGMKVHLCHACNNGNKCSNPRHLYWGTAAENTRDQIENGTHKNLAERTREKMGDEYAAFMKEVARKGGRGKRTMGL